MRVDIRYMCPHCPDASVREKRIEEALRNIREAIELYLEPVEDDRVPLLSEAALLEEIDL